MPAAYLLPDEPVLDLASYRERGGGEALEVAARLGRQGVIDEVEASGLRGRGGAGFPTGVKWRSVAAGGDVVGDRFVVANGAEGEPGTFKDRTLLRTNPFQVLEGVVVGAYAVGAREAYVALKASFTTELERVRGALAELEAAGWLDGLPVHVVEGPDEYLFGEEKALLEVIEGEDPLPRLFPPYLYGLFSTAPQMGWSAGTDRSSTGPAEPSSNPTLANNVETLANVPPIVRHGADWYRSMGTVESPGHQLVTVSGDTQRAGVREIELGRPLGDVLDEIGGGVTHGRSVRAVLSGVANPVLGAAELGAPLSYEGLAAVGSGLGAAGFLVADDRRDLLAVAHEVSSFLHVESCGQCPACKFGTGEVSAYLGRILEGRGTGHDVELVWARLRTVDDGNRCALPVQEREVVASILRRFPEDVLVHLDGAGRADREPLVVKIVDLVDGVVVPDERQRYKRPDWTYQDTPVFLAGA